MPFRPFLVRPAARLEPAQELVPESVTGWRSTGEDPQFVTRPRGLLPGWYMLEVWLEHDQPLVTTRLFVDCGQGITADSSVTLHLRSGQFGKRLFFAAGRIRALRFDPMESPGSFSIRDLRLVWLMPSRARDRLVRRLVRMHPRYRGEGPRHVAAEIGREAEAEGRRWRDVALAYYAETFGWLPMRREYAEWLAKNPGRDGKPVAAGLESFGYRPLVSLVVPTWRPEQAFLVECIESVRAQSYPDWQLCIVDDASGDSGVVELLRRYETLDARIEVVLRSDNGHVCAASNDGLRVARGELVGLLDHDDTLAQDALFRVVDALQEQPDAGLVYTDEDKIDGEGRRYDPHFKPEWNADLLLSQNYVGHLMVARTELVRSVGGFREGFEGSQDHDLALRCTAALEPGQIVHVPEVLYHWRASPGSTAFDAEEKDYPARAGLAAVSDGLAGECTGASVDYGPVPHTYRIAWPLPDPAPRVSLLVPTRDQIEVLRPCVRAILERTEYPDFELLIIDNQSRRPETRSFLEEVSREPRVRVIRWNQPFNYSAINNFGARHASGEVLALVNNDVEPIGGGWLDELVRQAVRPEIGCAGPKLYYRDGRIQHAGVILGIGGVAGHAHRFFQPENNGYFSRLRIVHNVSAVTGACLVVRKSVFDEVGGLDERNLPVAFNDVDFCLRVREAGYRNLFTPYAELYHYESVSRRSDDTPSKQARAQREVRFMRERWGELLDNDPAYNPNLSLTHEDFSLR